MSTYRAAWVLPIASPPIRDGAVTIDRGRVVSVASQPTSVPAGAEVDLGRAAILPGLVNAHTHLELSWLRGRIPPAASLPAWIRHLIGERQRAERDDTAAVARAIAEARAAGTALVGDVTNSLASHAPLVASSLAAVVFLELIGFGVEHAGALVRDALERLDGLPGTADVVTSLAAHAPYSVAPTLFAEIRAALDRRPPRPVGVHVAESRDELEFLATGGGRFRALLESLGVWDGRWQPPRCGPVEYLERVRFLGPRLVVAHGVHLSAAECVRLAALDATVVTCARSNAWTGAGRPPVASFYGHGVRVAVGTDSLASAPDLNLFTELAAMRSLAPDVPAARLLASATLDGARALGWDAELGSIEAAKRAALIAVDVPGGVDDVEEYLVRGVHPDQIRWL